MVLLLLFLRFLCISGKESLDLTLTVVLYRRISFVLPNSFLSYTEAVEPLLARDSGRLLGLGVRHSGKEQALGLHYGGK